MVLSPSNDKASRTQSVSCWRDWISQTYFELDVQTPDPRAFDGCLEHWDAGAFGLSRVTSTAILYRRQRETCRRSGQRILITIPLDGVVEFSQFKRQARCTPGSLFLEASDEPYELRQTSASGLLVLRVDESALRDRVCDVRRFFATRVESGHGLGRLFVDFLTLSMPYIADDPTRMLPVVGPHLLDLLGTALDGETQALDSPLTAVKVAHLARVDAFIAEHLRDPELSLDTVASSCRISVRYLQKLCQDAGMTGRERIRDHRLRVARDLLGRGDRRFSIASIAYRVGFSDHASFSRAFRHKFGCSPRDMRQA